MCKCAKAKMKISLRQWSRSRSAMLDKFITYWTGTPDGFPSLLAEDDWDRQFRHFLETLAKGNNEGGKE